MTIINFLFPDNIWPWGLFLFISCFVLLFFFIKNNIFKEKIREELTHKLNKAGTPSAGGMVFMSSLLVIANLVQHQLLLAYSELLFIILLVIFRKKVFLYFSIVVCSCVIFLAVNFRALSLFFSDSFLMVNITVFLALVLGFLDDIKKNLNRQGFSAKNSFLTYGLIGMIPAIFCYKTQLDFLQILSYKIHLGIFFIPVAVVIFIATLSGTNLTDGINGGLGLPTVIISIFFLLYILKSTFIGGFYPVPIYETTLAMYSILLFITLIPFLFFNLRGKVFMGNSGSLSIGALICSMALLAKIEVFLPIFGILFVIEVGSVLVQTYFFKKYGRRVLLFSPIHHHFELLGWSTTKIVCLMTGISVLGCGFSLFFV